MSWWTFDLKNVALLGVGLGLGVGIVAVCAGNPTFWVKAAQYLGWGFAAACLVLLLALERRRDLAPDFLALCRGSFYERDGFCFAVSLDSEGGLAMFTIMFQNRFVGPSLSRIALRPAGSSIATTSPQIECAGAGFGVAKFPVAVPARHQGKTILFELGVDTEYPLGKGREVRYRCGYPVRHNARFRSLAVVAQAVLHSLVGHFLIHSPAAVRLTLPKAVATEVPEDMTGEAEILWSLPKRESFIPPFMHP